MATTPEKILWQQLRNQKLGAKFRRQYSIGPYVVDFYSVQLKLVIELDGSQHQKIDISKYDKYRSEYLSSFGVTVIRFTNEKILTCLQQVVEEIKKVVSLSSRRRENKSEVD